MTEKPKILVVEDEEAILNGLVDVFVFHGFEVDQASDGERGLKKALGSKYDLILLDVMLPKMDGFSICNEIRKHDRKQPVIMLTAKSSEEDVINGLTLGADDYIAKPFSVQELVLRVQAVLRRSNKVSDGERVLKLGGGLEIDTLNLTGKGTKDIEILFTRREIDILHYLKDNSDRPVNREEMLTEIWGYDQADIIETRTVDIHIAKLRRKIEKNAKEPKILVTVRGEGYRLDG